MSDLTLPSGRVVVIRDEITYGEELDLVFIGNKEGPEAYHYAKLALVVPSLARDDLRGLSRDDGNALALAVNAVVNGRPEEKEIPFGNTSPPSSQVTSQRTSSSSAV